MREGLTDDSPVWRYVSLTDLCVMLEKRQLPLIQVVRFEDKFECSLTWPDFQAASTRGRHASQAANRLEIGPASEEQAAAVAAARAAARDASLKFEQLRANLVALRHAAFASCWRYGAESEAMWRLYCADRGGLAMRTTYRKLRDSVAKTTPQVAVEAVTYHDFQKESLDDADFRRALIRKRDAFDHEQEIRIFWIDEEWLGRELAEPGVWGRPQAVVLLDWDPLDCLDTFLVNPYADERYLEAARLILSKVAPRAAERLRASPIGGFVTR
jgi:hypothetical protein